MTLLQAAHLAFCFTAAFMSAYGLIWLVLMSRLVNAFTDRPDARKVHQRLVPRAGGICLVASVLGLMLLWKLVGGPAIAPPAGRLFYAAILAGIALGVVGVVDDTIYVDLSALVKLFAQLAVATGLILGTGIRFDTILLPGELDWPLGALSFPLSLLWLVGVTNAINIIDGLDGLAGTVSLISFATLAVLAGTAGDLQLMMVTLAFAGAILAFLMHNAPPARTFLGDTGSMFIGMSLGFLTMYLTTGDIDYPVVALPLIVAFPILDVAAAMVRRFVKAVLAGTPWYRALLAMLAADNEHIHHRLLHRGFQHSWVVCTIAIIHAIACAAAVLIPLLPVSWTVVCLLYLAAMSVWYLHQLDFFARLTRGYHMHRRMEARRRQKERELIGVVQADPVLQHALTHYEQELFAFEIVPVSRLAANREAMLRWAAVILENHYDNRLDDDIATARSISRMVGCPVFILSDGVGLTGWESIRGNGVAITFVNKPVYVPVVLKRLAETIEQAREGRVAEEQSAGPAGVREQPGIILRSPT